MSSKYSPTSKSLLSSGSLISSLRLVIIIKPRLHPHEKLNLNSERLVHAINFDFLERVRIRVSQELPGLLQLIRTLDTDATVKNLRTGLTGLEPATSAVTGRCSNQLN